MILGVVMGLDVGDVRTGVAVTDALQIMVSPLRTVAMTGKLAADADALAAVVREIEPIALVLGLPLNQHGLPGPQAAKVQGMAEALRTRVTVPIHMVDERFSTAEAHRHLRTANVKGKKQKSTVDQVAAGIILETYMQRERNRAASQG